MDIKEIFELLGRYAKENPELCTEIEEFVKKLLGCESDQAGMELLNEFKSAHPEFAALMKEPADSKKEEPAGKTFPVHDPFSGEIRKRIKLKDHDNHYAGWRAAIMSLPEKTLPLPVVDGKFLQSAKKIWEENVYGNEDILRVVLRHCIEYGKNGKTTPILLVGDPGIGKTLVAGIYGKILNLPCTVLSGPTAVAGRGLAGAPNIYSGASAGIIVQSMIRHNAGHPVICLDELDKTLTALGRDSGFQDELLSVLDDSSEHWYDNYLEIEVDASHIPFIFTANYKEKISLPLLDRMEMVEMKAPSKEMLHSITRKITVPDTLSRYDDGHVSIQDREVDMLVDMLWDSGNHSCRAYQKAFSQLVSDAYLDSLEKGGEICISEERVRKTAAMWQRNEKAKSIGFVI